LGGKIMEKRKQKAKKDVSTLREPGEELASKRTDNSEGKKQGFLPPYKI
jgi:hypothetical protein